MGICSAITTAFRYGILWLRVTHLRLLMRVVALLDKRPVVPHSRELYILSFDGKRQLRILIFEPPKAKPGPKPVHVTYDGSGYIFPMHGFSAPFCAMLAKELGCIVVNGDYRKSPEWTFPAAYDDGRRVMSWVLENVNGEFDTSNVTMSGFSAGGNIVLAVAGQMPAGVVKGVAALYPALDFSKLYAEKRPPPKLQIDRGIGVVIPAATGDMMRSAYLGSWTDFTDPRLCPYFTDLKRYPDQGRTFIASCEYDYLDEEAQIFKTMLVDAGREPVYEWVKGMGHGWDGMCQEGTEAARVRDKIYAQVVDVLRKAQES